MRLRRGRLLASVVLVAALAFGVPGVAMAAYAALGLGAGGVGSATLPAPGKPSLAYSSGQLAISWTATQLSTGRPVDAYQVRRTVGATTTTACTTTSLSCTVTAPSATASYTVVAKVSSWSATSAATTYTPDTTPPAITGLALSSDTGASSTDFVTDVAAQTLTGVTEPGSQVTVTYRGTTLNRVADGAGAFAAPLTLALGTYDITVTSTDQAGNTATVVKPATLTAASTPATSVVVPGNANTAQQSVSWQIPSTANNQFCVTTTVTGTSTTPQPWSLSIDLAKPPFYGATANQLFYQGTAQVVIAPQPGDATKARVTGSSSPGNPWNAAWNNALLDSSKSLTITLCDSSPQVPTAGDASWYTVGQTQGTRTATRACVNLTVTATTTAADNPFFFGWNASIDLAAAKQYLIANGKTINYVDWTPDPSGGYQFTTSPGTTKPVADSYALTSGRMTAVKAGGSTTIVGCVVAF